MSTHVDDVSALNCAVGAFNGRNKKEKTRASARHSPSVCHVCRSNKSRIFARKKKEKGKNVDIDE